MNNKVFVEKIKDIAVNYKTIYVMGCFGAPMNFFNKQRYIKKYDFNKTKDRISVIKQTDSDTFGFDCSCLIKAILWGWSGNKYHKYGGATYASNGMPDLNADMLINECIDISEKFDDLVYGEILWTEGHVGVFIGNGLAVESTPLWDNKVQITAIGNIGEIEGFNTRAWKKHGKLRYIDYLNKDI